MSTWNLLKFDFEGLRKKLHSPFLLEKLKLHKKIYDPTSCAIFNKLEYIYSC